MNSPEITQTFPGQSTSVTSPVVVPRGYVNLPPQSTATFQATTTLDAAKPDVFDELADAFEKLAKALRACAEAAAA